MKIVIDIPERVYKASQLLEVKHEDTIQIPLEVIANGTPHETVTEFADRCKECGKMRRCKECKFFEYDYVAIVDGIPLIVGHEMCNKWGEGCKTKEDGYCFLFEPKESEDTK